MVRYNWSDPTLAAMMERDRKNEIAELLGNMSHTLDDTFKWCYKTRDWVSCTDMMEPIYTDAGLQTLFDLVFIDGSLATLLLATLFAKTAHEHSMGSRH